MTSADLRKVIPVFLLCALAMSGCGRKTSPVGDVTSGEQLNSPTESAPPKVASLSSAALSLARERFENTWLRRGDSWYAVQSISPLFTSAETWFFEFNNVSASVTASDLSEADKLNGLEWQGSATFSARSSREAHMYEGSRGWSEWREGGEVEYSVTRRNGAWITKGGENYAKPPADVDFQKPELEPSKRKELQQKLVAARQQAMEDVRRFFAHGAIIKGYYQPVYSRNTKPFRVTISGDVSFSPTQGTPDDQQFSVPGHLQWLVKPEVFTSTSSDHAQQADGKFFGSVETKGDGDRRNIQVYVRFGLRDSHQQGAPWSTRGWASVWNGKEFEAKEGDAHRFFREDFTGPSRSNQSSTANTSESTPANTKALRSPGSSPPITTAIPQSGALNKSEGITAQSIASDDYRAIAVRNFLSAVQSHDLHDAFRRMSQRQPDGRTFAGFERYIQTDEPLNDVHSFRIVRFRPHREFQTAEVEIANSRGKMFNVKVQLKALEDDPEGESWDIYAITSATQFPPPSASARRSPLPRKGQVIASSERDLVGRWQGPRYQLNFHSDHTFDQDGWTDPRCTWRREGMKLIRFYPDLGDDAPPWYPLAGDVVETIISINADKLVTNKGTRVRVTSNASEIREAAAVRAKAEQTSANPIPAPVQSTTNQSP